MGTEESLDTWAETTGWLGRYAAVHTKPGEKPWENSDPAPSTQGDFVNSQTQESGACLPVAPLRERCHRSRRRPAYVIPAQAGIERLETFALAAGVLQLLPEPLLLLLGQLATDRRDELIDNRIGMLHPMDSANSLGVT